MQFPKKAVLALALLVLPWIWSGCSLSSPQNSSIPWNHPADWEGQMPGMNPNGGVGH